MPKFAILISKEDDFGWWKYSLIVEHKIVPNDEKYATAQAAFAAALIQANRRGYYV